MGPVDKWLEYETVPSVCIAGISGLDVLPEMVRLVCLTGRGMHRDAAFVFFFRERSEYASGQTCEVTGQKSSVSGGHL